jgi:hypothetical protein
MRPKRDFYRDHVDRRVRLRKLIYLLILLTVFGITLYDSFVNTLPFHYILFILVGRVMVLIVSRTQKATRREADNVITIERNILGISIVVAIIVARIVLFPRILTEMHVVYVSDAVLLIVMGWLLGRIQMLSDKIEEMAFMHFLEKRQSETK